MHATHAYTVTETLTLKVGSKGGVSETIMRHFLEPRKGTLSQQGSTREGKSQTRGNHSWNLGSLIGHLDLWSRGRKKIIIIAEPISGLAVQRQGSRQSPVVSYGLEQLLVYQL